MKRRLLRGVAAAAILMAVLLSGTAQPAQATGGGSPWLVSFSVLLRELSIEAAGGIAADEIQALARDTQVAIINAQNEIIDHADRIEVAEVKGEMRMLVIESYLLNPSYPLSRRRRGR